MMFIKTTILNLFSCFFILFPLENAISRVLPVLLLLLLNVTLEAIRYLDKVNDKENKEDCRTLVLTTILYLFASYFILFPLDILYGVFVVSLLVLFSTIVESGRYLIGVAEQMKYDREHKVYYYSKGQGFGTYRHR